MGGSRPGEGASDEDAAWADIVEHFGERARLDDADLGSPEPGEDAPAPAATPEPDEVPVAGDRFIPPPPPPAPPIRGWKSVAWLGVFVAPAILLLFLLTTINPPGIVDLLLVGWALGSLGYLVATMPRERDRDPWDDGSRV